MHKLFVNGTRRTPQLLFEANSGVLTIAGRSTPENATEFYEPLFQWLRAYRQSPSRPLRIEIRFEYFNTSSSRCLIEAFRDLEALYREGKSIQIVWFYEEDDEDMREAGEDFQDVLKLPLELTALKVK